jgi:hypothetical protein
LFGLRQPVFPRKPWFSNETSLPISSVETKEVLDGVLVPLGSSHRGVPSRGAPDTLAAYVDRREPCLRIVCSTIPQLLTASRFTHSRMEFTAVEWALLTCCQRP